MSTISKRLDEFEIAGLITQAKYNEISPGIEYALTGDGGEVHVRFEEVLEWELEQQRHHFGTLQDGDIPGRNDPP